MSKSEVVFYNPIRTVIGTYGRTLDDTAAPAPGAVAIRASLRRSGPVAGKVQQLITGEAIQAGMKMNPARQAGIAAGLPVEVSALTVNRVCGSGRRPRPARRWRSGRA